MKVLDTIKENTDAMNESLRILDTLSDNHHIYPSGYRRRGL